MLPRRHNRTFPELSRLPTDEDRRRVLSEARHHLHRSWRFWITHVAVLVVVLLLPVPFVARGAAGLIIGSVLLALALVGLYGLTPILFAPSMRRTIRLRLSLRGLPICLTCGYDMSGSGSNHCPECNATTTDCHVCRTRYTGLDYAICPRCGARPRKGTNARG